MSRFILSENANPNYLATICRIGETFPIEGADRLVKTVVNGYDVIVSKDFVEGDIVLYCPLESSLCEKFLSANNLYERGEFLKNANAEEVKALIEKAETQEGDEQKETLLTIKSKCGYFNKYGRVRMLKLKGVYSMGFITKPDSLVVFDPTLADTDWESLVGTQFNFIDDVEFITKFIPPIKVQESRENIKDRRWKKRMHKLAKRFNRIIEGEYVEHFDTKMFAEHYHEFHPTDVVTISVKCHGTLGEYANVLCKRNLSRWEKIKKFFGFKVVVSEYENVYGSHHSIKNQYINPNVNNFYSSDAYGPVNKLIQDYIPEGYTIFGEIVGYVEGTSTMIQKNHDYGCEPGTWKFMPYRIREKHDDTEIEWNVSDVQKWTLDLIKDHPECEGKLMPINILYHGPLGDLYPDLDVTQHWHENLLARMKADTDLFGMELDEPMCKNKVPREGIVIRIDNDKYPRAWKLKTARHYALAQKQHDDGEVDMEETA